MKIAIIDDLEADAELISKYIKTYFSCHCINMPLSIHIFPDGEKLLYNFNQD